MNTVNPATGLELKDYPWLSAGDVEGLLANADSGFRRWRALAFQERGQFLKSLSSALMARRDELTRAACLEMGKPWVEAKAEVQKCADGCLYYADHAEALLGDELLVTCAPRVYQNHRPLGAVLGIMPWNFPYWQVIRFAAPTLMAGNVVVVKHAPNTAGCAELLAQVFSDAGFLPGVYQNLHVEVGAIETILADHRIAAVSLTGSTRAGRSVAALAGRHLKKVVLELGGSDPYLVLDDADLDLAAEKCVVARMQNGGQSCISAKRFLVTRARAEHYSDLVVEKMKLYAMGDPLEPQTRLGPMARADLRDELHRQVRSSVEMGAKVLLGGQIPAGKGFFYPATVLGSVRPGMPVFDQETFGPVAVIVESQDEHEIIELADRTPYGLGAAIFSRDTARAEQIARSELDAGMVFVNDFVRSDSRWPFGGIKNSGFGRELSAVGIREFVNCKTIAIYD